MSDAVLLLMSKGAFGFAICVIIYLVYYEYEQNKIAKEKAIIELGEQKNEDLVDSESDSAVVDSLNKELSGQSSSSNKPK